MKASSFFPVIVQFTFVIAKTAPAGNDKCKLNNEHDLPFRFAGDRVIAFLVLNPQV
jgi:hypothetical protein